MNELNCVHDCLAKNRIKILIMNVCVSLYVSVCVYTLKYYFKLFKFCNAVKRVDCKLLLSSINIELVYIVICKSLRLDIIKKLN